MPMPAPLAPAPLTAHLAPMKRRLIFITGPDARDFLQGLVTNDIGRADRDGIVWAALLTPQGKYLSDFFTIRWPEGYLLDVPEAQADDLIRRLSMYKLRAKVDLGAPDVQVARGTGPVPEGALPDPRHPDLGWRLYGTDLPPGDGTDWDALRVRLLVPESGIELVPNDSYILEMGFDRLNGVDFRKGCYVGQEVTARMRHKTVLRKGLVAARLEGSVSPGTPVMRDGREVGQVWTQSGGQAIAYLRFDRIGPGMEAAGVPVEAEAPQTGPDPG